MSMKKIVTAGLIAGAVSLAAANAAKAETDAAAAAEKEKCYGVVKAGKNDCGSADKAHSCMGHATVDGSGHEWLALPKGVCEKLVHGSLTPAEGGEAMKAACDGKSDCAGKEEAAPAETTGEAH